EKGVGFHLCEAPAEKGVGFHLCEAPEGPLRGKWNPTPFSARPLFQPSEGPFRQMGSDPFFGSAFCTERTTPASPTRTTAKLGRIVHVARPWFSMIGAAERSTLSLASMRWQDAEAADLADRAGLPGRADLGKRGKRPAAGRSPFSGGERGRDKE